MENTMVNEVMENVVMEEVLGNNEEVVVEVVKKGNFGKNALIVAGLTAAGIAAYKLGKKVYKKAKAKQKDADIINLKPKASDENVQDAVIVEEKVVDMKDKKKNN